MPQATVTGSFSLESSSTFTSTFAIGNIQYSFSGHLSTGNTDQHTFAIKDAVLAYNSVDDLTGTRSLTGQVGISRFTLNLKNGPRVTGNIPESVEPASTVTGSGRWSVVEVN